LLKKEREEKRVEVRKKEGENLGIIGCVERTKATVDNVASASAISISRFSFFEKRKIYIYIKSRDRLVSFLCCQDCVIVFLLQSEKKKEEEEEENLRTSARKHIHKIHAHVHKLVIIIIVY
jgi:hypothetical protein